MSSDFAIEDQATVVDSTLERRAEMLHDTPMGPPSFEAARTKTPGGRVTREGESASAKAGKAQGKGVMCGYCGKPGHAQKACWAWMALGTQENSTGKGKGKGEKGKVTTSHANLYYNTR